ncbi:MAG: hypothetical protein KIT14_06685 [bacterium]|nr:hypothetical protein [bacterium]
MMRRRWWGGVAAALVLGWTQLAAAQGKILLSEVLGSWQGDDTVQFVELQMIAAGQHMLAGVGELVFDDAAGDAGTRRFFTLTANVPRGVINATILVATARFRQVAPSVAPDFTLPDGMMATRHGRVCYQVRSSNGGATLVDCIAYGSFTGQNGSFGRPEVTPDNRSLQRVDLTGVNRPDWITALTPAPQNNAGAITTMATLCGDGRISQGEVCDGSDLGGQTCASLGYARGKLRCVECHLDTRNCTFCGNDEKGDDEECDGSDFGDTTCGALGFTGGTLACSEKCRISTAGCDPTFHIPGGGPAKTDCTAEWRITNVAQKPGSTGKTALKQRCRDGDTGCDHDAVAGQCTFALAACFVRDDARLAKCTAPAVGDWTLLAPAIDVAPAADLVAAVAALAPSTVVGGAVTFATPLETPETCTETVAVVLPVGGKLKLRARTSATAGKPRDQDTLKLLCRP